MSELTPVSIKKLKVAELRSELSKLGLDTKGTKPVLIERLLEATSDKTEENNAVEGGTEGENETDSKEESSQESQDESAASAKEEESVESAKPSEVESDAKVEDEKVVEEKLDSEAAPPEKMETNDDESAAPEPPKETPKEEPTSKPEGVATETPKEEDKKVEKEEPMDETKEATPSKHEEDTPKEQGDDLDISVNISKVEEEPEVELDDSLVVLDKYNSDLHVKISPHALSLSTLKEEAFTYLCGGAKATWGVTSGKVCYELKVTELQEVDLPDSEEPKHFVRVGWSVEEASLQLGEDTLSFGYDSTAKKCTNSEFTDFGQTFSKDDVITCYLDLESEAKKISFSKNGEDVGEAFDLPEEVQGKALFPHVLIKNTECILNFGSQEEPWFAAKEGFTFIQNCPEDSKVHGARGPESKQDCEVMMMIGLPASGKTTYVKNHVSENPDKKYNILGTSTVLDRMKLLGVARKQEVGGYNKHMDKAAKCLHRLFEIAPSKKRNYILDQTNVYMSAQNKKMRPFEGFKRKAFICVPAQEVLKERMEQRKKEGMELPFNAVCDMKRSFSIPKAGEVFDEITYVDQDEETSRKIITEYVKDGNYQRRRTFSGSGEPENKRPRYHDRPRYGGHGGGGGGGYHGGGGGWGGSPRDYRYNDNRRGGGFRGSPQNRRGGSPQYGRGGRGGYRDNYRGGRGGYQGGGGRGGYQGGGGRGGYQGGGGGYQDKRSYGGGGGYGGNKGYGGGKSYGGGGSYGSSGGYGSYGSQSHKQPQQQQQQYNYNIQQQTPRQPATPQAQGAYSNYNQYYQNYQQYGQQPQQTGTQAAATSTYQQQYPAYYQQQGTYPQGGGYSGSYSY